MSRDFAAMGFLRTPEPTLQEELAGLGDDDVMDFMNLGVQKTGIDGTIFVSTTMGGHGPRVKYFEKTGKGEPSFSVSIGDEPRVLASSVSDRVEARFAPLVAQWVRLNQAALLTFWNEGAYWDDDKVTAFKASLQKIS